MRRSHGDSRFNPTMVRLLLHLLAVVASVQTRFNPTMVRLLRWLGIRARIPFSRFQSHNGAIATL